MISRKWALSKNYNKTSHCCKTISLTAFLRQIVFKPQTKVYLTRVWLCTPTRQFETVFSYLPTHHKMLFPQDLEERRINDIKQTASTREDEMKEK